MSLSVAMILSFLIGVISGLRSLTAPAVVAWAAHRQWIHLHRTPLAFMESTAALAIFAVLALGELVADKLPFAPPRTAPLGLIARIALGGLSGGCIGLAGSQSPVSGSILGALGGIAGAYGGYQVRTRTVKALKVPDALVAVLEDAVAIGGGLFIVSRF
jgi:uncharacterized membrane protein